MHLLDKNKIKDLEGTERYLREQLNKVRRLLEANGIKETQDNASASPAEQQNRTADYGGMYRRPPRDEHQNVFRDESRDHSYVTQNTYATDTVQTPAAHIPAQQPPVQHVQPEPVTEQSVVQDIAAQQPAVQPAKPAIQPAKPAEIHQDMPAAYTAPLYTYSEPERNNTSAAPVQPVKKKPVAPINIILALGTLFVSLAGFVFAGSAWGMLSSLGRGAVLISFSVLFFVIHLITEKKLDLPAAGKVFYILGSVFLPAAVFSAAVLKVFGDGFSFSDGNGGLVISVMAICAGVCSLIGAVHYDSWKAAKTGYILITLAAAAVSVYLDGVIAAAELAVLAFVLMLFEGTVKRSESINRNLRDEYSFFVSENIYVSALVSLFLSDGSHIFAVPVLIFSAAFLISALRRSRGSADIFAFCTYIMIGAYLAVRPESLDGGLLLVALVMIVYSVLSFMDIVPDELRRIVSVIRMIASGAVIAAGLILMAAEPEFSLSVMISALCVTAQLLITAHRGERSSLYAIGPAIVFAACEFSKLFGEYAPAAAVALCLVWIIVIRFAKKYYTRTADAVIVLFGAAELIYSFVKYDNAGVTAAVWLMLMVSAVICTLAPKDKSNIFAAVAAAVIVLGSALPAYQYTSDAAKTLAAVTVCQFLVSVVPLLLKKRDIHIFVKPLECGWAVTGAVSVMMALDKGINEPAALIVPLCAAAYFVIRSIVIRQSSEVDFIFESWSDIIFCLYFAVMLFMDAKPEYTAAVFACLVATAALSDRKVRSWALPAALMMLFIPAKIYTQNVDISGAVTAAAYGITAAALVYAKKNMRKNFIILFPALLIPAVTAVDERCIITTLAVGAAAMLCTAVMHARKEHGGLRILLTAVTVAAYAFSLILNVDMHDPVYHIVGVVLCFFTVISFALGKDRISAWMFPVSLISLYFPLAMFSSLENADMFRDIAAAASAAVFIIGMYLTGGRRTQFKVAAPLLFIYPVWILIAYGAECNYSLPVYTAAMLLLYCTAKGEGRTLRRLAALCLSLAALYAMAYVSADISSADIASKIVFFLIWLCIPAALTREHILHRGRFEEICIIPALAASYMPVVKFAEMYLSDPESAAFIAMICVMAVYRLLCLTDRLITQKIAHLIIPVALAFTIMAVPSDMVLTVLICAAIVFAVSLTDAYLSAREGQRRFIYPSFAAFMLLAYQSAVYISSVSGMSNDIVYIALTAAAVLVMLPSLVTDQVTGRASKSFTFAVMPFITVYLMLNAVVAGSTAALVCCYIMTVISAAAAVGMENTILMYIALPVVFIGTYIYIGAEDSKALLTLIPVFVSVLFGRLYFSDTIFRKKHFSDAFSLIAVSGILPLFSLADTTVSWTAGLALAVWLLLMSRKEDKPSVRYTFLTLAACMVMPLWWFEPFFDIPELVRTEVFLVPPVISLVLLYVIHSAYRDVIDVIAFITAVIELLILFFDAAKTGYAFDAVFLGAVILCILGLSFVYRQKRWFALAVCSAAAEALLMTIKLWNSRIWWVYLLIAGIILIAVGIGNELKKKRIEQGKKTKLERVMEEWTW